MKLYKLLFILPFFSSCLFEEHKPTQSEFKEVIDEAKYDTSIINMLTIYQSLAEVLSKHSHSIVPSEYSYNSVAKGYNLKDMPDYVYQQVDSLWKQIGENNIKTIAVTVDKAIIITPLINKASYNTLVIHQLIWNMQAVDNNQSFSIFKDTLLSKNCTYRIGVHENNSGW